MKEQNAFLLSDGSFELPISPFRNGTFETDTDNNGLADRWGKGMYVTASLVKFGNSNAQKVIVTQSNTRGLDQGSFEVSDKKRYRLKLRIRVDSCKVQIIHHDINRKSYNVGSVALGSVDNTGWGFVTKEYEFIPNPNVAKMTHWL